MADIRIHRSHHLGLARARQVAAQWAEQAQQQFGLQCTTVAGKTTDTVEFARPGASGTLTVAADRFDLEARLGFLLGAFSTTIESEIEKVLDALLAKNDKPVRAASAAVTVKKPAAKKAARK